MNDEKKVTNEMELYRKYELLVEAVLNERVIVKWVKANQTHFIIRSYRKLHIDA